MDKNLKKSVKKFPHTPGVYLFSDKKEEIIYIGKAINLFERAGSYFKTQERKTKLIISQTVKADYLKVFSEFESLLLEAALIKKYQPKYNVRLKDNKSFLYIAITKEEFPKVKAARKNDLVNPQYWFGPFPSAKTVHQVLKFLRKVIPFCGQKGNPRPCFWSHLGLCHPCPGAIVRLGGEQRNLAKKEYLININHLVSIFSGKSKSLLEKLKQQMEVTAKSQDFELATKFRDQAEKLAWLTSSRFSISSYLENSSLVEEEQKRELTSLRQFLEVKTQKPVSLQRIECFDVSNLLGQFATGSMVVFINGVQSKDDYRRFKIKISGQPNDPAMLAEVLKRRLKHREWNYPNLIIIDGGKPQVTASRKVLSQAGVHLPVIGLAKRLEEIVLTESGEWQIERLPANSPALNLLKRIRDESHRFALSYHKKLRKLEFDLKPELC